MTEKNRLSPFKGSTTSTNLSTGSCHTARPACPITVSSDVSVGAEKQLTPASPELPAPDEQLMCLREVAAMLRRSERTLRRWRRDGQILAVRIGGTIRIRRSDLDRALRKDHPKSYNGKSKTKDGCD